MAREARNKGFATRAVVLVSVWAFDALHLNRLSLTTIVGNTASDKVAAKAGFRQIELVKDQRSEPNVDVTEGRGPLENTGRRSACCSIPCVS